MSEDPFFDEDNFDLRESIRSHRRADDFARSASKQEAGNRGIDDERKAGHQNGERRTAGGNGYAGNGFGGSGHGPGGSENGSADHENAGGSYYRLAPTGIPPATEEELAEKERYKELAFQLAIAHDGPDEERKETLLADFDRLHRFEVDRAYVRHEEFVQAINEDIADINKRIEALYTYRRTLQNRREEREERKEQTRSRLRDLRYELNEEYVLLARKRETLRTRVLPDFLKELENLTAQITSEKDKLRSEMLSSLEELQEQANRIFREKQEQLAWDREHIDSDLDNIRPRTKWYRRRGATAHTARALIYFGTIAITVSGWFLGAFTQVADIGIGNLLSFFLERSSDLLRLIQSSPAQGSVALALSLLLVFLSVFVSSVLRARLYGGTNEKQQGLYERTVDMLSDVRFRQWLDLWIRMLPLIVIGGILFLAISLPPGNITLDAVANALYGYIVGTGLAAAVAGLFLAGRVLFSRPKPPVAPESTESRDLDTEPPSATIQPSAPSGDDADGETVEAKSVPSAKIDAEKVAPVESDTDVEADADVEAGADVENEEEDLGFLTGEEYPSSVIAGAIVLGTIAILVILMLFGTVYDVFWTVPGDAVFPMDTESLTLGGYVLSVLAAGVAIGFGLPILHLYMEEKRLTDRREEINERLRGPLPDELSRLARDLRETLGDTLEETSDEIRKQLHRVSRILDDLYPTESGQTAWAQQTTANEAHRQHDASTSSIRDSVLNLIDRLVTGNRSSANGASFAPNEEAMLPPPRLRLTDRDFFPDLWDRIRVRRTEMIELTEEVEEVSEEIEAILNETTEEHKRAQKRLDTLRERRRSRQTRRNGAKQDIDDQHMHLIRLRDARRIGVFEGYHLGLEYRPVMTEEDQTTEEDQ